MNTLKALRGDLRAVLQEISGLDPATASDFLPERIPTPSALIVAGSPYIESGDTFGSYAVRHTVILVCAQGTNETATDDLDEYVAGALVALDHGGWAVERVDQPSMLSTNNTNYLSTTIDVIRRVTGIDDGSP